MAVGPYAIEQDYSHYLSKSSKISYAVVGPATKGPVEEPTLCTSPTDLVRKFGPVKPGMHALYAAMYYLNSGNSLHYVRAQCSGAEAVAGQITVKGSVTLQTETIVYEVPSAIVFETINPGSYYNSLSYVLSVVGGAYYMSVSDGSTQLEKRAINLAADPATFTSAYLKMVSKADNLKMIEAKTYSISTGADGMEGIAAADYVRAGNLLSSMRVDMNLFAIPGVSDSSVVSAMLDLAEARGDCLFLVDPPQSANTPSLVEDWHNGVEDGSSLLSSSYGALYFSWQTILDPATNTYIDVPPSVPLGYLFAKAARESEIWYPVAGVQRGLVSGVYQPVYKPDDGEVSGLYEGNNAVNCIVSDPTYGLVVWGQKTLARTETAVNRVHVRMLLNYLKRVVVAACKYLTFEPNDQVTWESFEDLVEPTLKSIGKRRGLYDYKIVKGNALVTPDDIDNYRMPCKILIKPTKDAEYIPVYFTITSTGADFNEILESEGIVDA